MKAVYEYKESSNSIVGFKDIDGKKGIVTGYFSDFNSIDSDGDIIKPGAYTKSIAENGPNSSKPRIKHLFNHNVSQPLGRLTTLKEDSKGLYYESQVGTHSLGLDFIKMAESGLITEHSVGFTTVKYNQLKPWSEWKKGEAARELTELKLYEGSSLSGWGANQNTPLTGIKNGTDYLEELIKKQDAIEKFCRNSNATDETIELLLIQSKQLTQHIIELSKTTQPVVKTVEPDSKEIEVLTILETLKARI